MAREGQENLPISEIPNITELEFVRHITVEGNHSGQLYRAKFENGGHLSLTIVGDLKESKRALVFIPGISVPAIEKNGQVYSSHSPIIGYLPQGVTAICLNSWPHHDEGDLRSQFSSNAYPLGSYAEKAALTKSLLQYVAQQTNFEEVYVLLHSTGAAIGARNANLLLSISEKVKLLVLESVSATTADSKKSKDYDSLANMGCFTKLFPLGGEKGFRAFLKFIARLNPGKYYEFLAFLSTPFSTLQEELIDESRQSKEPIPDINPKFKERILAVLGSEDDLVLLPDFAELCRQLSIKLRYIYGGNHLLARNSILAKKLVELIFPHE